MESVHYTITGPFLRMRHGPSACTVQHVTVPIRNVYQVVRSDYTGESNMICWLRSSEHIVSTLHTLLLTLFTLPHSGAVQG